MTTHQQLWTPSEEWKAASGLQDYMAWLKQNKDLVFEDYQALWIWSVDRVEDFWESLATYFKVVFHHSYEDVLSSRMMPGAQWFHGATLSYGEHIFRHKTASRPAMVFQNEEGRKDISWEDLEDQVLRVQQYLVRKGITKGDRVVCYLPNIPEAIVAFLAVNSLGAIWSCCSPDFGVETVIERFTQIAPKVLIAGDGYSYNGKPYNRLKEVEQIAADIDSIKDILLVSYLNKSAILDNADLWEELSAVDLPLKFEAVSFDHPIWVLYSSGTTGKPKAITHSHGGVLLEHLKYMAFHNDVKEGEHFFWFTTTGWMMWNFLQGSMLIGAVPVLYDGSPGYPSMDVLWDMAEELQLQHFGTSAPYLTACMKQDLAIRAQHDLSRLRSIGSTGAPLPPEAFEWIYKNIKGDLWLCSMSGGTDVCTAFMGGNPLKPVYKGLIQTRALGWAMYAYDDDGQHVVGSLGEMVIEQPMPSMPIYFWNDTDDNRYKSSYFDTYPGKWRHGDWINLYEDGSLIITGRSDATLNRKGIRIGTAEIYNVLDQITTIQDALILNIELPGGDDTMPLFVKLKEGAQLDEALKKSINASLRKQCSPRHVPDTIIVVPGIPFTLSGKKMEVPVKKLLMGMTDPSKINLEAIKNPEAMMHFVKLKQEGRF